MIALLVVLHVLGAAQGIALTVLLFRLDPRARRVLPRGRAIALSALAWELWALGGLLLLAGWVLAYPWRRRVAENRARAEGKR